MSRSEEPVTEVNGNRKARDRWLAVAVALYLMATTISFASTTLSSRAFIEPVRLLALAAAVGIVFRLFLQRPKFARTTILGVVVYGIALCYGLILAAANGGVVHVVKLLYADVALTLTGIYLFSSIGRRIVPQQAALLYLLFTGVVLALTIAVDGFTVTYPPHFTYEYLANRTGADVYYSQGVSKFFGLAAILAVFLVFSTPTRILRLVLFTGCIGALGLSLIGGARGDSVAAALVVLAYSAYRSPRSLLIWFAVIGGAVLSLQGTIVVDDFMIFNRLMNLQGEAGIRGVLLREAGLLMAEEPACLIVGCGFGFFQTYFGYDSNVYPHNIAVEAVIVWGLPAVLGATALGLFGFVTYLRRSASDNDAFLLVYMYFSLLFLKSGTILGAWFVVAGSTYFLTIGLDELLLLRRVPARTGKLWTVGSR